MELTHALLLKKKSLLVIVLKAIANKFVVKSLDKQSDHLKLIRRSSIYFLFNFGLIRPSTFLVPKHGKLAFIYELLLSDYTDVINSRKEIFLFQGPTKTLFSHGSGKKCCRKGRPLPGPKCGLLYNTQK